MKVRLIDYDEDEDDRSSAKRMTPKNQRNRACGNCGKPNKLTPEQEVKREVCDECKEVK